jgi:adenosine deaminase CECR1
VAATNFPDGGKEGFIHWLKSRVSITRQETLDQHLGPNAVWRKFTSCFGILASLQHYEPIFRKFIRNFLQGLLDDGVRWVDIRSVFVVPFTRTGEEEPDADYVNMLQALQEEIDAFKKSEEGQRFWGARLIWTTIRSFDTKI